MFWTRFLSSWVHRRRLLKTPFVLSRHAFEHVLKRRFRSPLHTFARCTLHIFRCTWHYWWCISVLSACARRCTRHRRTLVVPAVGANVGGNRREYRRGVTPLVTRIGRDRNYYEDLMERLNGVLIPGGATYFNQSDGYADAGQHIYEIAMEMNDAGDYFPIFGTCLGFELLIILASGRGEEENRITCYSYDNLPLDFVSDFRDSKMFSGASDDIIHLLATEDVTVNAHQFCIVDDNLKSHKLTDDWRVTSYSDDAYGVQFIASIEHNKYPFYGVQFHPEKSSFEWKASKNYPSNRNAVKANRYFMDFFVDECRKSSHAFATAAEENEYVIYNHEPHFTGVLGSAYHQCYLFEPRGTKLANAMRLHN